MGLFSSTSYEYVSGIAIPWDKEFVFEFSEDIVLRGLITGNKPLNYLKDAVFNGYYTGLRALRKQQKASPVYTVFPRYVVESIVRNENTALYNVLAGVNQRFNVNIAYGTIVLDDDVIFPPNENPKIKKLISTSTELSFNDAVRSHLSNNYIYNATKGKVSYNGFIWDVTFSPSGTLSADPYGIGRQDVQIVFTRETGEYSNGEFVTETHSFIENLVVFRPEMVTLIELEHEDIVDFDGDIFTLYFIINKPQLQDTFSNLFRTTTQDLDIIHPYTNAILSRESTKRIIRRHSSSYNLNVVETFNQVKSRGYYRVAIDFGLALEIGTQRNTAEAKYIAEFFKAILPDISLRPSLIVPIIDSVKADYAHITPPSNMLTFMGFYTINENGSQVLKSYLQINNKSTLTFIAKVPLGVPFPKRTSLLSGISNRGAGAYSLEPVNKLGIGYVEGEGETFSGTGIAGDIEIDIQPNPLIGNNLYDGFAHLIGDSDPEYSTLFESEFSKTGLPENWKTTFLNTLDVRDASFDITIREWITNNQYIEFTVKNVTNTIAYDNVTIPDTQCINIPMSMSVLRSLNFSDRERLASKAMFVNIVDRDKVTSNLFLSFVSQLILVVSVIATFSSGGIGTVILNLAKTKIIKFLLEKAIEEFKIEGTALLAVAVVMTIVGRDSINFGSLKETLKSVLATADNYSLAVEAYNEVKLSELIEDAEYIKQLEEEAEYYAKLYEEEFGETKLLDIYSLKFENSDEFFRRTLYSDTTELLRSLDLITPPIDTERAI